MCKIKLLILVPILLISCKTTSEFTGYSYDPPGVTNTVDKLVYPQKRRVIGAGDPKVWVSNEDESTRMNDFYEVTKDTFEVFIKPENAPINNSPWFGFKIWSDSAQSITLRLKYENARHRYEPKIGDTLVDSVFYDSTSGTAEFQLELTEEPVFLSAQFRDGTTYSELVEELSQLSDPFISVDTAGFSHEQRTVYQVTVDETTPGIQAGVLILLSRQHPPETTGYLTYHYFFEALLDSTELAQEFRSRFIIESFPMINPDGVYNGHWRHNVGGNDLNRDWQYFNQPETRSVKEALMPLKDDPSKKVFYGIDFHSTNENIFYPINEEIVTFPDNFTQRWAVGVQNDFPELDFSIEEFPTDSPISKNWIYKTFGADALTFEVDDQLTKVEMEHLGHSAAQSLMRMLLEEWNNLNGN